MCIDINTSQEPDNKLRPYKPYFSGTSYFDKRVLAQLQPPAVAKQLTDLCRQYGADNVTHLAEIREKIVESGVGIMGAATSAHTERVNGFSKQVLGYQHAILDYSEAYKNDRSLVPAKRVNVMNTYTKLQAGFKNELAMFDATSKARKAFRSLILIEQ